MSPPGEQHGIFAFRVAFSLGNHVEPNNLGQVYIGEPGFKLAANPDTVRAPDIAFLTLPTAKAGGFSFSLQRPTRAAFGYGA